MKTIRLLPVLLFLITMLCGIQFPTRYERVENDRVRGIAFVFDNKTLAEAAPGDTVTLRAFFAGERVNDIQWTVAATVVSNFFAGDTFGDTVSLTGWTVPGSYREYFGGSTDSAVLDFVVPADVISRQFNNVVPVADLIPPEVSNLIPPAFLAVPVPAFVELFDSIAGMVPDRIAELTSDSSYQWLISSLQTYGADLPAINPILQIFSINIKIFALVNGKYRKESQYTVRYNSRFHYLEPAIPVNHNPLINWIEVCRLKKGTDVLFFDPLLDRDKIDTVFPFDTVNDTITIDEGYRYFLVCDSATASLDSGYSLTGGNVERENLLCRWFFRDEDQVPGVPLDSLVGIGSSLTNAAELLPPVDTRMQRFSVWLVGYDDFAGERLRPRGFTLLSRQGVFRFSEDYKRAHR